MEENRLDFFFHNVSFIQISRNKDKTYSVSFVQVIKNKDDDMSISLFNKYEDLLYGIAPFCKKNFRGVQETVSFLNKLYLTYVDIDDDVEKLKDSTKEILLNPKN